MVERINEMAGRWGAWPLLICAFADASVIPAPVITLFLVLIVTNFSKVYKYTSYAIIGTFAGSLAGYLLGHFAWLNVDGEYTAFAQFILVNIPGFSIDFYEKINSMFNKWDIWLLLIAAATPIPYGIFSIASGIFNTNVIAFGLITLFSQSIKFSLFALITFKFSAVLARFKTSSLSKRLNSKAA